MDDVEQVPILGGTLSVNLLENRSGEEAWFNISVDNVQEGSVLEIREELYQYTYKLLSLLRLSLVDVNVFVLSFHIRLINDKKSVRHMFFRTDRSELNSIFATPDKPVVMIEKIKNQRHDELFQ